MLALNVSQIEDLRNFSVSFQNSPSAGLLALS